jgi:TPP-dependent pyruvate/acetoin dehydrogenase alpha subunit
MSEIASLYRQMQRIRRFEESVLEAFPRGVFYGTTHTYIGQEANAVGVISQLNAGDIVFSNHRCHGHFLAYGGDPRALFAELMGKATGVCGGRGGSQHIHWKDFYSNGVLGSTAPAAVGAALAEKLKGSKALAVIFIGDGALGEGVLYESLNMASLWKAPVLFVLENNAIAQTTPVESAVAGDINARFEAFGIPCLEMDSSDVLEIQAAAAPLLDAVRAGAGPRALHIHTVRFGPHSKGDDTREEAVMAKLRAARDPLSILGTGVADKQREAIEDEVNKEIGQAFAQAEKDPFPAL